MPGAANRVELATNAASASKEAGVEHLVLVSVLSVEAPETLYGGQFAKIESHVKELGLPYTFLRLPFFF